MSVESSSEMDAVQLVCCERRLAAAGIAERLSLAIQP
jgi:hypothetical protein